MTIDWQNLGFSYTDVNSHICYTFKDGFWDNGELNNSMHIPIHIAATALHYGQAAFEGLKAFRTKDGKICVFRPQENVKRLQKSCRRILMPEISEEMFLEAIKRVILANEEFIPPYGTGGSLYIRPLMIGTGAKISVEASNEYKFIILVIPVGVYYKGGLNPVDAIIVDGYDRAAINGVGNVKVAGNYAASLQPAKIAKSKGFPITLYLDSQQHKFIDEFGTSNFIAIKDNSYITPSSNSILLSITNLSLMQLAKDMGLEVIERVIKLEEINDFDQVAACGTAVVITPISSIYHNEMVYSAKNDTIHPILEKLYKNVLQIQYGEIEDIHQWNWFIDNE